ncbi:acyl-CoA dehydrogenase family protein [Nonomuraea sp. NPDC050691]|uniref:acyl-CoA dehydrogenase family protein n=1 Tax=Nonomuraea sp. NPDC050691 TaxID=3155661 RepID=UPI0033CB6DC1
MTLDELLRVLRRTAAAADRWGEPDPAAIAALRLSTVIGLAVPEEYGGEGGDAVSVNRAVEGVATADASTAIILAQHFAVTARIVEHGSAEQRQNLLPRLATGEWLAASAWSELGAGANKRRLSTTARRERDVWQVTGTKSFTTSSGIADLYLVLAQTGTVTDSAAYGSDAQTFLLIEAGRPGLTCTRGPELTGMRGSATGFVELHDCEVSDGMRLGPEGGAAKIISEVRASGYTLGAVSVGIAQAAYDTVHDLAARKGMLAAQAVRHRLFDIAVQVETARSVVERAGRRDSPDPGTVTLYSKVIASSVAEQVCREAQQLAGSAGFTRDHPIDRQSRDARAVSLMGPTNDLCRELVSISWGTA